MVIVARSEDKLKEVVEEMKVGHGCDYISFSVILDCTYHFL